MLGEKIAQEAADRQKMFSITDSLRDISWEDLPELVNEFESMRIAGRPSLRKFGKTFAGAFQFLQYYTKYGFDSNFKSQFDDVLEHHKHMMIDVSAFCISWLTNPVIMSVLTLKQLSDLRKAMNEVGKLGKEGE